MDREEARREFNFLTFSIFQLPLRDTLMKKNGRKRGHCPLLATPPPKRGKRGHLLSDYRQKRVNASRDILMSKARKMTILTITMFYDNVHTGCLFLTGTS